MCKVVNIKSLSSGWQQDDNYVYIGRRGRGHDGYFGNPFPLQGSREECLRKYTEWFHREVDRNPEFKNRVLALKHKTLVCFCAPLPCHGHVIAQYLEQH